MRNDSISDQSDPPHSSHKVGESSAETPHKKSHYPDKNYWRTIILDDRRTLAESERQRRNQALIDIVQPVFDLACVIAHNRTQQFVAPCIAAYVPSQSARNGSEPGSLDLLDTWRRLGADVLLPLVPAGVPATLQWSLYRGPAELKPGRFGLLQPQPLRDIATERLITTAHVIFVPCLAVDHHGTRLGRGGGYYDRSLPFAASDCVRIGCVDDNEVLTTRLPTDKHDIALDYVANPYGGLRPFPLTT